MDSIVGGPRRQGKVPVPSHIAQQRGQENPTPPRKTDVLESRMTTLVAAMAVTEGNLAEHLARILGPKPEDGLEDNTPPPPVGVVDRITQLLFSLEFASARIHTLVSRLEEL